MKETSENLSSFCQMRTQGQVSNLEEGPYHNLAMLDTLILDFESPEL